MALSRTQPGGDPERLGRGGAGPAGERGLGAEARSATWGRLLRAWRHVGSESGRGREGGALGMAVLPTRRRRGSQSGTGVSGCSRPCSSSAPVAVGFGGRGRHELVVGCQTFSLVRNVSGGDGQSPSCTVSAGVGGACSGGLGSVPNPRAPGVRMRPSLPSVLWGCPAGQRMQGWSQR